MSRPSIQFGALPVGDKPRIVGILSALDTVSRALDQRPPCDLIEFRLDRIGVESDEWLSQALKIEAAGWPVIATLRIPEEGGNWKGADADRLPHFKRALDHLASIDTELRSPLFPELAAYAKERNKAVIVSHHDYDKTPSLDEMRAVIERGAVNDHVVVKIAVRVNEPADIDTLRKLLAMEHAAPLCLIGMGDLGTPTRIEFPRLGSCLTYGHLDISTAPGQLSCEDLARNLKP